LADKVPGHVKAFTIWGIENARKARNAQRPSFMLNGDKP
jgi:hypothetical protein